ncbi:MAG: hypothetical protein HGA66_10495 [Holophaga sp.]|nr:hypothetical protein [Holophaga sp.]
MRISRTFGIAAVLAAAGFAAQAQDVKVNILTEFWYTQTLDNVVRYNTAAKPGGVSTYYEGLSSGRLAENGFTIKRAEVYASYKISDEWGANIMFDPNNSTSSVGNNILQDLVLAWTPKGTGVTVRGGQFKMPTTYESTLVSARDIIFYDRHQLARVFSERRDRGVWATYTYGKAEGFKGNVHVAVSNGSTDDGSGGKTSQDANAQKDYTFRFDGSYGKDHKFGFYYRAGQTNLKVPGATIIPAAWTTAGVTQATISENRDKTTMAGIFYAYDTARWHFDAEYATGLLGRRFPTIFTTAAAPGREHLDQKFTGYAVTGVYRMGAHQLAARYDLMNYNSGDDWYTATSPYKTATGDFSPKYTEVTVGYNYLFNPSKYTYGKVKVDYILRSKNFLNPAAGQTGEQGGNSAVMSVMVGF